MDHVFTGSLIPGPSSHSPCTATPVTPDNPLHTSAVVVIVTGVFQSHSLLLLLYQSHCVRECWQLTDRHNIHVTVTLTVTGLCVVFHTLWSQIYLSRLSTCCDGAVSCCVGAVTCCDGAVSCCVGAVSCCVGAVTCCVGAVTCCVGAVTCCDGAVSCCLPMICSPHHRHVKWTCSPHHRPVKWTRRGVLV